MGYAVVTIAAIVNVTVACVVMTYASIPVISGSLLIVFILWMSGVLGSGNRTWTVFRKLVDRAAQFFGRSTAVKATADIKHQALRGVARDLTCAVGNGQLHLHYQPLFRGDRLVVVGYEALLRWHHPTRGNITPSEFIPLAEECGAILEIGRWVLETACAEAASWPEPYGIAVNIWPAQVQIPDLPAQIAGILDRTGLAPERLELEVTEGMLMEDSEHVLAAVSALKAQGIRIALDEFGAGYSSLDYLRRFPFDSLKVDRSFIAGAGSDPVADALISAILAMAGGLHLSVTADGVETQQQLDRLRTLKCDHLQGNLLGRPLPPSDLAHMELARAAAA